MNRPWKTWLIFSVCGAVLLAAMGWISLKALRLDRAQADAQQQTEFEERVRLALWRMDSMLAPIIAQESARPYFVYRAFYATERAYNKMFNELQPGEVLVPSPLLTQVSSNVLLHFQYGPDGQCTSPQVPTGNHRDLAETSYASRDQLAAAAARLQRFQQLMEREASSELVRSSGQWPRRSSAPASGQPLAASASAARTNKASGPGKPTVYRNNDVLLSITPPPQPGSNPYAAVAASRAANRQAPARQLPPQRGLGQQMIAEQQAGLNQYELEARAQSVQQALDLNLKNTVAANYAPNPRLHVAEGLIQPVWFGDALVLSRRVLVGGVEYLQGCWLDWPGLREGLLQGVQDLLPGAALQPLANPGADPQARMLASLPVRLVPGAAPASAGLALSPILFALLLAWACLLLATVAVAALLHGALSLSERRGAFVSAVTHELRTPLTTFKLYAEMLAAGMVTDEAKRKHYLDTLCAEANRLSHLVENVLAYARLERGSARRSVERLTLGELIDRVKPRLIQRADQAGMTLAADADPRALAAVVHVEVPAVEQILFNLVDNACKYAAPTASEKIIHLEALPEQGKFALLRVRDHGQGISDEGVKRLFQPFSKSAHEAALTAPGVGLGLALCRRLSRSMGGDLRLERLAPGGASFVLSLPVSAPGPASIA